MPAAAPRLVLSGEKSGRAMIRSYSDVFENKGPDQKTIGVGERIEGAADSGSRGQAVEAVGEIDGGAAHRRGAQGLAKETHVVEFVLRDFESVLL